MIRPHFVRASLATAAALTLVSTARAGDWDLSRYQDAAYRDSLAAHDTAPATVVLDRQFVEVKAKGTSAYADVSHELVMYVRDAGALGTHGDLEFFDYPGHEIDEVDAFRVGADEIQKLRVEKSDASECNLYRKQERHRVNLDDVRSGDVVAVRVEYEIEGQNPTIVHRFDRALPVVQSDITFEVSKSLLEGKTPGIWNWWAGSHPGRVAQMVWEKPTSYRFRWGEAEIADRDARQRSVISAWAFDPSRTSLGKLVFSEAGAKGSDIIGHRGKTMSARELSGAGSEAQRFGIDSDAASQRPTEASYGTLHWEDVAALFVATQIEHRVEERHLPKLVARMLRGAGRRTDVVEHLIADVDAQVSVVNVPLRRAINDLHRPMETYDAGCASAVDKALCLVGVLRTQDGVNAYPVLLKRSRLVTECKSVEVFDEVGVIVETADGKRFVDVVTGRISDRMPSGLGAALTLPVGEPPQILLGDAVASLARAAG